MKDLISRTGPLPSPMDARFAPSRLLVWARESTDSYLKAANMLAYVDPVLSYQLRAAADVQNSNATRLFLIVAQINADHTEALEEKSEREQRAREQVIREEAAAIESFKWQQCGKFIVNAQRVPICKLSAQHSASEAVLIQAAPALHFTLLNLLSAFEEDVERYHIRREINHAHVEALAENERRNRIAKARREAKSKAAEMSCGKLTLFVKVATPLSYNTTTPAGRVILRFQSAPYGDLMEVVESIIWLLKHAASLRGIGLEDRDALDLKLTVITNTRVAVTTTLTRGVRAWEFDLFQFVNGQVEFNDEAQYQVRSY